MRSYCVCLIGFYYIIRIVEVFVSLFYFLFSLVMVIVGFGTDVSSTIIISVNLIGVGSVGTSVGTDVAMQRNVMIVSILYYFN